MIQHIWVSQFIDNRTWCGKIVPDDSLTDIGDWLIDASTCIECWENVTLGIGVEDEGDVDGYRFDPRPNYNQ